MLRAIKQRAVVRPGGVIEVRSPDLPEGSTAEVLILVEASAGARRPLATPVGAGKGGFAAPEEVARFLRHERDAWGS
jgi:hypothetical protein